MTLRLILILLIALVALAGVAGYQMIRWAEAPALSEYDHPPQKIVVISEGETSRGVVHWRGETVQARRSELHENPA